jgi:hypothetical protein
MKRVRIVLVAVLASAAVTVARSGHELPVYPSYYPHEIEIQTVTAERAASLLLDGEMHAMIGSEPRFADAPPDQVRAIESLGSFIVVRLNPSSPLAKDDGAACEATGAVLRAIGKSGTGGLIVHPYPVTPWHGDYLHHIDLAEAAKNRVLGEPAHSATPSANPKVKAGGALASLVPPDWRGTDADWDAEIAEIALADLLAPATFALNGWQGPPWARAGWFHATLLLAGAVGDTAQRIDNNVQRLQSGNFESAVDRINLERDVVSALAQGCRTRVAGYRVKREFINVEFSAGIENVAFDALDGLNSSIFIRTAKLKDFPWNGWLSLGVASAPTAAWNPIAGFTDPFGRLMWTALGDPAAVPSPYESTFMLNRVSEIEMDRR